MHEPTADARELLDAVLVLRSCAGDDGAFGRLVDRYHQRLLYFVRRLIGANAQAEDIVQEAWLAAYRQLGTLQQPETFRTWLYRIARNRALSFVRDLPPPATPLDEGDVAGDVPDEVFTPDDAARIHAGLARLRLDHREALTLRFIEGMSYEQLAAVLECDPGTVKSRLHYAKKALRKEMETTR